MSEFSERLQPKGYGPYEFRLGDELRGERATIGRSLLDIQRDLRIKAAYIAAIENCDPSVFPNPSFIAGYVRSYARYLHLDPDEIYWRFCQESGFAGSSGAQSQTSARGATDRPRSDKARGRRPAAGEFYPAFPLAEGAVRSMPNLPLAAVGSLLVLVGLIAGLGYGGWTLLQNVQRVQFAPIDEVPVAVAEAPVLASPVGEASGPLLPELATPVAATALFDLYRQQELEVPILVPRDGPIAALDPDAIGLLARARSVPAVPTIAEDLRAPLPDTVAAAVPDGEDGSNGTLGEQAADAEASTRVTIIAERPAWIRVYFPNGSILFEQILESGEVYDVPPTAETPRIWAGNSGSVYVKVDGMVRGPIGSGTRAVRDVVLEPAAISERFDVVNEMPRAISETISNLAQQAEATILQ